MIRRAVLLSAALGMFVPTVSHAVTKREGEDQWMPEMRKSNRAYPWDW